MINKYFDTVCWFTEAYIDILEKVRNIHILVEIIIIEDFKDNQSVWTQLNQYIPVSHM